MKHRKAGTVTTTVIRFRTALMSCGDDSKKSFVTVQKEQSITEGHPRLY